MNIRTPQPTQAARLLKSFFASQGVEISHSQALEAVSRLHGYQNYQAMQADTRFADAPALKPVSSNEYELGDKERAVWIGVDGISVYVARNDEGVSVDLYAKGHEDESLMGTYLHFDEAADAAAEAAGDAAEAEEDAETNAQAGFGGKDFIISDVHGAPDHIRAIMENRKDSPFVLDGPNFHGVYGSPDSYPCGEIPLGIAQPCVLTAPAFEPAPVDWQAVVDSDIATDLTHLRINNDDALVRLEHVNFGALNKLARVKDLSAHVRMSQMSGFVYVDQEGYQGFIPLGVLQKAFEHEEGVIDLIDGRQLQLLRETEQGELLKYSPQQNSLTKA